MRVRGFKTFRNGLMIATALAGGAAVAAPASAWAQSPAAQQTSSDYNIPSQDLSGALRQFAVASKLQLIYDAKVTADKRSAGVKGTMTAEAALSRILAGSGLGYSLSGSAVTISQAAGGQTAAGPRFLAPVRVQGFDDAAGQGSPVNGINGSRDVTATEGTNSYTSGALDIVSKIPQSIKDTPQTVSVVTAQQIADENLNDLATALAQAPGITVVNTNGLGSSQQTSFYSRGFPITTLQIDGGAPLDIQSQFGFSPSIDMSEYDSLQIIRGADGLFGGYGNPSGVIDLVRKKPLDHAQVTTDSEIASWNNYREVLDITGPLTADKSLKGRVVVSYQDNDYFYKIAHNDQYHIYGNLEYDLSNTTINIGGSYTQQRQIPNASGIPTYANGGAPSLPVSTCLCFSWSRDNTISTEAFAQVNHKFNKDWGVKLDFTYENQSQYYDGGAVSSSYPPVTPTNPIAVASAELFTFANKQYIGDFTLNGGFDLFGHKQYLVVGGSYQFENGPANQYNPLTFAPLTSPNTSPSVNIFTFNPNAPQYARAGDVSLADTSPSNGQEQYTAYANAKITILDPLHLIVGFRFSGYAYHYSSESFFTCQPIDVLFGFCSTAGATITSASPPSKFSDNHFSLPPDASLVYDVTKNLSVYASYTDIYISNAQNVEPDGHTPIAPTTGYNEEIGVKWQRPDKKLNASFDIFNIDQVNFADYLGFDFGPGGTPLPNYGIGPGGTSCCYSANAHRSEISQGVDLELAGEITKGWNFSGSYTYDFTKQKGSQSNDEGAPTYSGQPRHLVKLYTTYTFQSGDWIKNLSVGGGLNYQSETFFDAPLEDFYNKQKDYALLNLRAAYKLYEHWNLGLDVTNATNTKYFQTLGAEGGGQFYGQPAAFTLSLKGKW
jgi:TonB-dependent siderophore receptor